MTPDAMTRRGVLLAGGALGLCAALSRRAGAVAPPPIVETVPLVVGQRRTSAMLWRPVWEPTGVALFSHGHGSWPDRYGQLAAALAALGFVVVAPLHVDSVHHPDRGRFTLQQSFPERLADMDAARALATARFAGLPVIAVGHSFGTLTALCLGGALAAMGPFRDPVVKAVLGFSTPGRIPGLVGPDAFTSVQVPVMIVTGTADVVPGFVTDPADHLFPAETVPSDSYAIVVDGADHGLVAEPAFSHVERPVLLFADGHGRGARSAVEALAAWRPVPGDRFTMRRAKP